jgi:hypothetical protein
MQIEERKLKKKLTKIVVENNTSTSINAENYANIYKSSLTSSSSHQGNDDEGIE